MCNDTMTVDEARAEQEADDILRHKRLRDEFAMAALLVVTDGGDASDIARNAYAVADAMMVERDR